MDHAGFRFNSALNRVNLAYDLCAEAVGLKSGDVPRTHPDFTDEERMARLIGLTEQRIVTRLFHRSHTNELVCELGTIDSEVVARDKK